MDDIALDFMMIYKRYKDTRRAGRKRRHGEEGKNPLRRHLIKKERLDKHPC